MRFRFKDYQPGDGGILHFTFIRERDAHEDTIVVSFKSIWEHSSYISGQDGILTKQEDDGQANELLRGVRFHQPKEDEFWSQNQIVERIQSFTNTIFVSIPHDVSRDLFYQLMNLWAQYASCPLEAQIAPQPGYPLIALVFNEFIVDRQTVYEVAQMILSAIATLKLDSKELEISEDDKPSVEQEEEELDPDAIFEQEVDQETATLIARNQRTVVNYESMDHISGGSVVEGEFVTAGKEQAATTAVPPFSTMSVVFPFMYVPTTSDWVPLLQLYAQMKIDKNENVFASIPEAWIMEHMTKRVMWCHPLPEWAYRATLPSHAQAYSDAEIIENFPDYDRHVRKMSIPNNSQCILEHPIFGTLVIKKEEPSVDEPV